jgi:hypothetical protein
VNETELQNLLDRDFRKIFEDLGKLRRNLSTRIDEMEFSISFHNNPSLPLLVFGKSDHKKW